MVFVWFLLHVCKSSTSLSKMTNLSELLKQVFPLTNSIYNLAETATVTVNAVRWPHTPQLGGGALEGPLASGCIPLFCTIQYDYFVYNMFFLHCHGHCTIYTVHYFAVLCYSTIEIAQRRGAPKWISGFFLMIKQWCS